MLTTTLYAGTFPAQPDQIRRVRREVADYLRRCPASDDVVLIAGELVANAVLHGGPGTFTVRVERRGTQVYLEVQDAGGPWVPGPADGRPHGLGIVALLARTWGVRSLPELMSRIQREAVWAAVGAAVCGGRACRRWVRHSG
jgi:hypothetical protein